MTYPQPPQPGQPQYPGAPPLIHPTRPPSKGPNWWVVGTAGLGAALVMGLGIAAMAGAPDEPAPDTARNHTGPATAAQPAPETEPAAQPEPEPEPEPAEPELTVSQEQAVGSAQDYLDYSGFSRQGLIDQLKFEGFSEQDATFAVDYIDADWMKQAVRVAESYLDYSHFSRQGLIDQLEFEGFTTEQAEHGADEVGL
ncbi:MAG TPA: Ltp family lipoprotein [Propionibacteriaceae bacterium]|nr:Ltp family lipoprotein [Propionibacteriaceae bacterium]